MSTSYYFSQLSLILVADVNRTLQKLCGIYPALFTICNAIQYNSDPVNLSLLIANS